MSHSSEADGPPLPQQTAASVAARLGGLTGLRTALVELLVIALCLSFIVLLTMELFKDSILVQPISVPDE